MALDASRKKNGTIHTYGSPIHNPRVLQILERKGIEPLRPEDTEKGICPGEKGGTLIIRAHGVGPTERRKIKEAGGQDPERHLSPCGEGDDSHRPGRQK